MLTRVNGMTFDSLAEFVRTVVEHFKWHSVKIFSRHPHDPRFTSGDTGPEAEIVPMLCYWCASGLVREFRTQGEYNYDSYQMEVWKGDEEYEYTLLQQLGNQASGKLPFC